MKAASAAAAVFLLLTSCRRERGPEQNELTIVVQGDRRELVEQERALEAREAQLKAEEAQLERRLDELSTRARAAAADAQERRRLEDELARARARKGEIGQSVSSLAAQRSEMEARATGRAPGAAGVAAAETDLAAREARLGAREADFAAREKEVASRERSVAAREQSLLGKQAELAARERALVPAGTPALAALSEPSLKRIAGSRRGRDAPIPSSAPAGRSPKTSAAKAVEARYQKLLAELDARGILLSDLPAEDQPIASEIGAARREGDLPRAAEFIVELSRAVSRVEIDQRFVERKMVRIGARRAQARLPEGRISEVEALVKRASEAYAEGRYGQANRSLNEIAAILDGSAGSG